MKSKVLAALVATMAVGATCAFAANPFVDVPSDSWAYKSVVELADAGIIQGVDGSYFQGERNITRYEAAEMTAKAMAHMDKASVEQRALINKLADEYADELNNLGVRVSNLENRVGNVKLTGDARIRYVHQSDSDYNSHYDGEKTKDGTKNDNSWDYRVRIRANANVNDRTKVTYGLSTDTVKFADNNTAQDDNGDIYTDLANVDYNFGGNTWDLKVGRMDYMIGSGYGYQYSDTFDGVQLQYDNGRFGIRTGYGKFKEGSGDDNYDMLGMKTGFAEIDGHFGNGSTVGVYYNDFTGATGDKNQAEAANYGPDDLWGAFASVNFGQKWNALVDYQRVNQSDNFKKGTKADGHEIGDADVWVAKLTYGKADFATPKSWNAWVEYINADEAALWGSSDSWRNYNLLSNVKSWGVGANYTFAKNAQFQVFQSFASSAKQGDVDPGEETRAQFVFVF
jgi:hypothetical protein